MKKIIVFLILTFFLILITLFFGGFISVILLFRGEKSNLINLYLIAYIAFTSTIIISLWIKDFVKKTRYIPIVIIIIPLIIVCTNKIIKLIDKKIPTLNEQSIDLRYYEPFNNQDTLAKVNNSTLKLDGILPRLDCSTALYPVLSAFLQATYPNNKYDPYSHESLFRQTDTRRAYERLIKGEVDIILVSPPSKTQLEDMAKQGIELNLTPIGKEAFVFFVNSKNPIDTLTVQQIQDIYSGKITNWKDVGGHNEKIRAFQRPKDSGSQTALEKMMNNKELIEAPTEDIPSSMGGIIEKTANYKNYANAIGFSFRYFSTEMIKNNLIKFIKLNGVYPDKETIISGEYPMSSDFYAVTINGNETDNINKFIEWMQSSQGQHIVEETGYVALTPSEKKIKK